MDINKENSKKRIIDTAVRIFAGKGFSGARIDEIAEDANVNKALIYYYFKNKKSILNEIFSLFFKESTEMLVNFIKRGGFLKDADENKRLFEVEYIGYLESNKDILKIIIMESLTGNIKETPIFKLVDIRSNLKNAHVEEIQKYLEIPEKEKQQMFVTEFFTGVIPFINYIVFKDNWCKHFNISEIELKNYFVNAMEVTHEQHHKKK